MSDRSKTPPPVELLSFDEIVGNIQLCIQEKKDPHELLTVVRLIDLKPRELQKLGSLATKILKSGTVVNGYEKLKLGVISNVSWALFPNELIGKALTAGFLLDVVIGPYDQAINVAMNPEDPFYQNNFDFIIYAVFWQGLEATLDFNSGAADIYLSNMTSKIEVEIQGLLRNANCPLIIQNLTNHSRSVFGNIDRLLPFGSRNIVDCLNSKIIDLTKDSNSFFLDFDALASEYGKKTFFSAKNWHWVKQPMNQEGLSEYLNEIIKLIISIRGKSKKVLVLDMDNTIWGGVIGDDGIEGIEIGPGSAAGEAFLEVQKTALSLKKRGIVLAVASKNDLETVKSAIEKHPEIIFNIDDFAVLKVDWNDKASNIKSIAKELNVGIDSIVFIDDNPFEREQVRQTHAEVLVPELPVSPHEYSNIILDLGCFEAVRFTKEDLHRYEQYKDNAKRAKKFSESVNLESFLLSLNMGSEFGNIDDMNLKRSVQLLNKSNQFNLTTRRFSEQEVKQKQQIQSEHLFYYKLEDKFGDNGLISVLLCTKTDIHNSILGWHITDWVMSCRVLGREMEKFCINTLVTAAKKNNARYLLGEYIPTSKNSIVNNLYSNLGFQCYKSTEHDGELWLLDLDDFKPYEVPIKNRFINRT